MATEDSEKGCDVQKWLFKWWVTNARRPDPRLSEESSCKVLTLEIKANNRDVVKAQDLRTVWEPSYPLPGRGEMAGAPARRDPPAGLVLSHCIVSDSLQPHGRQHTGLAHPLPSPWVCSDSCPLSRWCHPTISSSVPPFSYPQSFPASGSFPVSQLIASGGQSIEASASASVLSRYIQDWFPLRLTG